MKHCLLMKQCLFLCDESNHTIYIFKLSAYIQHYYEAVIGHQGVLAIEIYFKQIT